MHVIEWYVGLQKPHYNNIAGIFGHVTAWGYTMDDTWVFLCLNRKRFDMTITHINEEVTWLIAQQLEASEVVLKIEPASQPRIPILPMTCAAVVGHLVGIRAWTPKALKRKLLARNAEIVKWAHPRKMKKPNATGNGNADNPSLNAVDRPKPTLPA